MSEEAEAIGLDMLDRHVAERLTVAVPTSIRRAIVRCAVECYEWYPQRDRGGNEREWARRTLALYASRYDSVWLLLLGWIIGAIVGQVVRILLEWILDRIDGGEMVRLVRDRLRAVA
jgi:hypothetical protein